MKLYFMKRTYNKIKRQIRQQIKPKETSILIHQTISPIFANRVHYIEMSHKSLKNDI